MNMRKLLVAGLMLMALGIGFAPAVLAQDAVESVCLVTDIGRINDGTFNQFAYEGMVRAVEDFGLDSTFIETQAQTDYAANIQTCLDEGYDIIVTVGFLLADATAQYAAENPGTFFVGVDQFVANPLPNYVGIQFREDQAGFLVGAMAALLTTVSEIRQAGYDQRLYTDPGAILDLAAGKGIPVWAARAQSLFAENQLGATTHISVIDADRMAAAMTTSNGEGCGEALPGLGIHVNNFLGEDDINPAGFHQGAPGTWMSTMMSPTIVVAGERPCFALGSGGSNRIRSAILQTLLNLLAYRRPLKEAVNAPRLHVEGTRLWFESHDLGAGAAAALQAAWPAATCFDEASLFFGGVNCVANGHDRLYGAGDRRRGGVVVVAEQ